MRENCCTCSNLESIKGPLRNTNTRKLFDNAQLQCPRKNEYFNDNQLWF